MKNKLLLLVSCILAMTLSVMLISASFATSTKTIVYSNFKSSDGEVFTESISSKPAFNVNEVRTIITRDGSLAFGDNLQSASLVRQESKNGCFSYAIEEASLDSNDMEVTMPVFYAEREVKATKYFMYTKNNAGFSFCLCENNGISRESEGRDDFVVIKCDFDSADSIPYECSLIVNEVKYPLATRDIYFDNESGNASRAYMTFYGLTAEDINDNSYVSVTKVLDRFEAQDYEIE